VQGRERDEALRRETATAEVWQAINSSPATSCRYSVRSSIRHIASAGVAYGGLVIRDGGRFQRAAGYGRLDLVLFLVGGWRDFEVSPQQSSSPQGLASSFGSSSNSISRRSPGRPLKTILANSWNLAWPIFHIIRARCPKITRQSIAATVTLLDFFFAEAATAVEIKVLCADAMVPCSNTLFRDLKFAR
jgi:hypothetical protein